jgi:hypothetical protein
VRLVQDQFATFLAFVPELHARASLGDFSVVGASFFTPQKNQKNPPNHRKMPG